MIIQSLMMLNLTICLERMMIIQSLRLLMLVNWQSTAIGSDHGRLLVVLRDDDGKEF
jgi:hypothetical protein